MDQIKKKKPRPFRMAKKRGKTQDIRSESQFLKKSTVGGKKLKKSKKNIEYWRLLSLSKQIEKKDAKRQKEKMEHKRSLITDMRKKQTQKNKMIKESILARRTITKTSPKPNKKPMSIYMKLLKMPKIKSEKVRKKYLEKEKLKFHMRKGNNQGLMLQIMQKRGWWESLDTDNDQGNGD